MTNKKDKQTEKIFRVDKFNVPSEAREEFVEKVRQTHELLKKQPGFIRYFILEQTSGPGEFNFVTLVEWENDEAIRKAKEAVQAMQKKMNFNPQEMISRLGIKADIANYEPVFD